MESNQSNENVQDINTEQDSSQEDFSEVRFDYIKSNYFRVIHSEGVSGGITPRLNIHMDFWSERPSIPKQVVYKSKDGFIKEKILDKTIDRNCIVREVDIGVTLDVETAKSVIAWLQEKIDIIETIINRAD